MILIYMDPGAICFDPNKNEIHNANFTPYVDHVMNFQTLGSLECLDTVEFGAWQILVHQAPVLQGIQNLQKCLMRL